MIGQKQPLKPTKDDRAARVAMNSANRMKLGLFGANCSSGRAVTLVPERWSGAWSDCVALAKMADAAGLEFMLPIGRWKVMAGERTIRGRRSKQSTGHLGFSPKRKS